MATIGGRQVSDVARERKANIKATGGLPAKKMTPPQGSLLGNDAKNIKIRGIYENMAEGLKRSGRGR